MCGHIASYMNGQTVQPYQTNPSSNTNTNTLEEAIANAIRTIKGI